MKILILSFILLLVYCQPMVASDRVPSLPPLGEVTKCEIFYMPYEDETRIRVDETFLKKVADYHLVIKVHDPSFLTELQSILSKSTFELSTKPLDLRWTVLLFGKDGVLLASVSSDATGKNVIIDGNSGQLDYSLRPWFDTTFGSKFKHL